MINAVGETGGKDVLLVNVIHLNLQWKTLYKCNPATLDLNDLAARDTQHHKEE